MNTRLPADSNASAEPDQKPRSVVDKALGLFSDVHGGEAPRALAMMLSLFSLMLAYYMLKTTREDLVLASGHAEWKSYAAGLQAVLLIGFVIVYGIITKHVGRRGLIIGLIGFWLVCLEFFAFCVGFGWKGIGIAFYVWVGIFSLSVLAQFWSFANDVYKEGEGKRLFPIIAFGATIGSPIGSKLGSLLLKHGHSPALLMHIAAVLLFLHGVSALLLVRNENRANPNAQKPLEGTADGFRLIWKSTYLKAITLLIVLLNTVNSLGEYILSETVVEHAKKAAEAAHKTDPAALKAFIGQYSGAFYGDFFTWVNIIAAVVQLFLVSRLVKYLGMRAVILFFPVVAIGVYGGMAIGVGFIATRWLKTVDNATDYSVQNTANALIWLPTTREEKYRAKQAVDTFFVRFGDVVAAGFVAGAVFIKLAPRFVALVNVGLGGAWLAVAFWVAAQNAKLSKERGVKIGDDGKPVIEDDKKKDDAPRESAA
jgi:AAA family ATP:ADP antiporter